MTTITPVFSIEDKQAEVGRLATLINDRRLDWQEAISVAIDAMTKFKPSYATMQPKEVLRLLEPDRFLHIKMAKVCVTAMAILMSEFGNATALMDRAKITPIRQEV